MKHTLFRKFIEAFAVITSVKYGIWAVAVIFAGASQGDSLVWQDWMLVVSHSSMAVEALLFTRFYSYGWKSIAVVGAWTLWNDAMDYGQGIFPWLPDELKDDLHIIALSTISLSLLCILTAALSMKNSSVRKV
jgi:uncharacterized membrane protein YpjA